jgi:acyl-coenzyme A thioesterase PaaI-like protein
MPQTVLKRQNNSRMCVVCGLDNPFGLKAAFYELENGSLAALFTPAQYHQGYPGRLHGGLANAILDETIGRAIQIVSPEVWGVTVDLVVRYRQPVPLGRPIRVRARITGENKRFFEGAGEIVLADGRVAVEGRGRYLKQPVAQIAGEGFTQNDWFAAADAADPRQIEI